MYFKRLPRVCNWQKKIVSVSAFLLTLYYISNANAAYVSTTDPYAGSKLLPHASHQTSHFGNSCFSRTKAITNLRWQIRKPSIYHSKSSPITICRFSIRPPPLTPDDSNRQEQVLQKQKESLSEENRTAAADAKKLQGGTNGTKSASNANDTRDWSTASSLGSFLLMRKKEEEDQMKNLGSNGGGGKNNLFGVAGVINKKIVGKSDAPSTKNRSESGKVSDGTRSGVHVEIVDETDARGVQKELEEKLSKNEKLAQLKDAESKPRTKEESKAKQADTLKADETKRLKIVDVSDIDTETVRELDEAVTLLTVSKEMIMKDIKTLPMIPPTRSIASRRSSVFSDQRENAVRQAEKKNKRSGLFSRKGRQELKGSPSSRLRALLKGEKKALHLSDPQHTDRIGRDMRHLAVSIASSVDSPKQWQTFCNDGGGLLPLLQCIRDGARAIEEGEADLEDDDYEGMLGLVEQREEAFVAACSSCKAIRDLCAISKLFSAVVTDGILRADAAWSMSVPNEGAGLDCSSGGLISHLVTMLRHANEADALYSGVKGRQAIRDIRARGVNMKRLGNRRQRKETRRRCGLYVCQLLLAMAVASDAAVNTLRSTSGLTDAVVSCSSYAPKERLRRRWIRYPLEVLRRIFSSPQSDVRNNYQKPFLAAASVSEGLTGSIQSTSNQLLAAIGHNVWVPKIPGQKGLRILCLDGGGTRGVTAISSLSAIVNAMGGIEVCDAFDIIAGTSTGAIIGFLVGLRRESSALARKRYFSLIKRIFVKSALSTPMLVFTTATYDETPFKDIMKGILGDQSMLDSRADPRVPLVFAIASKMSSTPTQLCLFRNYNYSGGEKADTFVVDPGDARRELGLKPDDDIMTEISDWSGKGVTSGRCAPRNGEGSRHPGSFRVLQRAAVRATTAAPTVFKPVLMAGELYCDGGIVASNPTAVAIHEARTLFPNIPIEMVVSCGTGGFFEEKSPPKIGWDGIIGQIVNSATDGEQTHHILEDILGQGGTAQLGRSSVSQTRYYRLNPIIGMSNDFPIDGTDPARLEELSKITMRYMQEPEQARKLKEIGDILDGKPGWRNFFFGRW